MSNTASNFDAFGKFTKPFTIGLSLLAGENPIRMDENAADYLAEKRALFAASEADVFQMEPNTIDVQNEVLDFVLECVADTIDAKGDTITCPALGIEYNRRDFTTRPLALASLLVQEDLVIMRRKKDGWTLVAASLCFPSSWKLSEKFGKPLAQIHRPVPGANKTLDPIILRIFDNLKPDLPVWRENWSFYGDDKLRHSTGENERTKSGEHKWPDSETFLRREYQTLHRLPVSSDILFTIRILVEPLEIIEKQENAGAIAATLLKQINELTTEQSAYKNFANEQENIRRYLSNLIVAVP